jgi:hypothetical protein
MNLASNLSSAALLLSFASLCVSLYVMQRDKGLSALASSYLDPHETLGYRLGIYVVNKGRSPMSPRKLVIEHDSGDKLEYPLHDSAGAHLKLAQSEFHEFIFTQNNSGIVEWAKARIKAVQILDSYGKTWPVQDFVEIINRNHHTPAKPRPVVRPAL